MSSKVLNLKLKYKNKYLDTAKHKRDFTNKFEIGTDQDLQWQILSEKFPARFTLLTRLKDKFVLHLHDKMDILVKQKDKIYTRNDLESGGLLHEGSITLEPDQIGRLKILDNWEIEFSFSQPKEFFPSSQEVSIIKQVAKHPPLSNQEKFTRIFLIWGTILTITGLMIMEANYVPAQLGRLSDRLMQLDQMATLVRVEEQEISQPAFPDREEVAEETSQQQVKRAQQLSAAEFQAEFGLSLSASLQKGKQADLDRELLEVTEVQEIVAAGNGFSQAPVVSRSSAELDRIVSKIKLDENSGFDNIAGLDGVDLASLSGFEEIDALSLGGNIGDYKITRIESKKQFEEVKKRFSGIRMMTEQSIEVKEELPQQVQTELASIDKIIGAYKPQIIKEFTTQAMITDMYGTIEFTIIINRMGNIEAIDINVFDGSFFTPTFLNLCRQIIQNWKINVSEAVGYSFRMKFYK